MYNIRNGIFRKSCDGYIMFENFGVSQSSLSSNPVLQLGFCSIYNTPANPTKFSLYNSSGANIDVGSFARLSRRPIA